MVKKHVHNQSAVLFKMNNFQVAELPSFKLGFLFNKLCNYGS